MGVLDAAKHINSAEKFKVTARLGHVVIAILNRSRFWAHGHDAVQQMLAGFWRQVDVYKPSTEFYSRASTVAKKFKALAPYLAAVANTDKNIAAAMISWSLCRYARQLGCFSSSLCCRDGAYLPAWAK
jgi:gamma-glutamylcysteine synthetase